MFSGKSEELIRRVRRSQFAKQKIAVFKPEIDDRYSEEAVVSHNGTTVIANPVASSAHIEEFVTDEYDVIAIDEAQFFDEGIVDTVMNLADRGFRVIIADSTKIFAENHSDRCRVLWQLPNMSRNSKPSAPLWFTSQQNPAAYQRHTCRLRRSRHPCRCIGSV